MKVFVIFYVVSLGYVVLLFGGSVYFLSGFLLIMGFVLWIVVKNLKLIIEFFYFNDVLEIFIFKV